MVHGNSPLNWTRPAIIDFLSRPSVLERMRETANDLRAQGATNSLFYPDNEVLVTNTPETRKLVQGLAPEIARVLGIDDLRTIPSPSVFHRSDATESLVRDLLDRHGVKYKADEPRHYRGLLTNPPQQLVQFIGAEKMARSLKTILEIEGVPVDEVLAVYLRQIHSVLLMQDTRFSVALIYLAHELTHVFQVTRPFMHDKNHELIELAEGHAIGVQRQIARDLKAQLPHLWHYQQQFDLTSLVSTLLFVSAKADSQGLKQSLIDRMSANWGIDLPDVDDLLGAKSSHILGASFYLMLEQEFGSDVYKEFMLDSVPSGKPDDSTSYVSFDDLQQKAIQESLERPQFKDEFYFFFNSLRGDVYISHEAFYEIEYYFKLGNFDEVLNCYCRLVKSLKNDDQKKAAIAAKDSFYHLLVPAMVGHLVGVSDEDKRKMVLVAWQGVSQSKALAQLFKQQIIQFHPDRNNHQFADKITGQLNRMYQAIQKLEKLS